MDLVAGLTAKGHTVDNMGPEFTGYDVILGPTCWAASATLVQMYLDVIVKSARARRYGPQGGTDGA